jgi:translation elongation factor EF-G
MPAAGIENLRNIALIGPADCGKTTLVPLGELWDYGPRLKALTGGEGAYTLEFDHYEPAPPAVQQRLAQEWQAGGNEAP